MNIEENLHRWFKERWTAQDGSPCGAYEGKGRVKCRPSKRVNKNTAQTWGEMSKGEKRKAVTLKQKAHKKGHQFSSHKTGKTWEGKKYSPKRKINEGVEVDHGFLKTFIMDAIKNPKKFYALLTLTGVNAAEATKIVYNLKHPRLTSSSFSTKMKMLHLLQNIIELITHDRILYSRLRSLAMSGEFGHVTRNVISGKLRKGKSVSFSEDSAPGPIAPVTQTSIGASMISPIAPQDSNPPAPLAADRKKKKHQNPIMMLLRRIIKKNKPDLINVMS